MCIFSRPKGLYLSLNSFQHSIYNIQYVIYHILQWCIWGNVQEKVYFCYYVLFGE